MKPERVLILHDYAGSRGGAELLALDLRRGLRARGIDARLMTTRADHGAMPADVAPDYLCAGSAGALRALPETWNPSARRVLARVLREFRPDVVHLMMFLTALSPAVLPLLRDVPVVHTCNTYREVCPTGLRWRPDAGLCTLAAGRACREAGCFGRVGVVPRRIQLAMLRRWQGVVDRSVAPSQAMARILRAHGWPVSDVFPVGVPAAGAAAAMAEAPVIAFAGRLTAEKGVGWLIDAVGRAGERLGGATVEILGDGPERPALEARAGALGLGARVAFRGRLERAASQAALARAWVQVVPSLWAEPFGLVTAEAMMRGTPAIVTDQGAQPEIVQHGRTGWVVPAGDVEALAEALIEATGNRARLLEMGAAAAADARGRFDMDRYLASYVDIYERLLDETRGAAAAVRGGPGLVAHRRMC